MAPGIAWFGAGLATAACLEFTWTFVLHPAGAERTRLLVRTRSRYAPRLLAPLTPVAGLFDATYGRAMLGAIGRRAEHSRTAASRG